MANLVEPDKRTSEAVDVRQELDLRIGEESPEAHLKYLISKIGHTLNNEHPFVALLN